jgi:hypothetical protein
MERRETGHIIQETEGTNRYKHLGCCRSRGTVRSITNDKSQKQVLSLFNTIS